MSRPMTEGIIIKALSGFYYVQTEEGLVSCKARGRFRLDGTSPLVGDRVRLALEKDGSGRIDAVCERRNFFIRPAVANIDALVFIAANVNPVTDPFLIDRVSVIAREASCELILCVNKVDLDAGEELYDIYTAAGFRVIRTSAETGEGADALFEAMRGKVCALTGNSGVGKSSILNVLLPEAAIPTDAVSEHLGRGRHTTRRSEMMAVDGMLVLDTPGFSLLELEENIEPQAFAELYPEYNELAGECRFQPCLHDREPGCAVHAAVDEGKLSAVRWARYRELLGEVKENWKGRYL